MSKHVFIAMPFGVKQDVDFNRVYAEYLKPALEEAGFEVFRADEEMRPGNILEDMFQELLLADLVVADLSIDNPNVWYELGVRHALRPRGVLQVQCLRDYLPFDLYGQRTLRYHVKNGAPDPEHLEKDKQALAEMALATINSWTERKMSPVYSLLPYPIEAASYQPFTLGQLRPGLLRSTAVITQAADTTISGTTAVLRMAAAAAVTMPSAISTRPSACESAVSCRRARHDRPRRRASRQEASVIQSLP